MSKLVTKNALILIFVELFSKGFEFVSFLVLARMLGAERYGLMNFAYTIGMMFILLPHFGFDQLIVRDISRQKELAGRYLIGITVTKAFLFAITLFLMMVWLEFFTHFDAQRKALIYISLGGVFFVTNIFFTSSFFRAYQKASIEAAMRISMAVMVTVASLACILLSKSLFMLFMVRLLVAAIIFALSFYLILKWLKPNLEGALKGFKAGLYLQKGWPFAISIFFILIYISMGVVMLNFMAGDRATGLYSVASKFIVFFLLVPAGISNAVLPALSEKIKADKESFQRFANTVVRNVFIVGVLVTILGVFTARPIIALFFGKEYMVSGGILALLSWSLVPTYLNHVYNSILLSSNKEKTVMFFTAGGAVFNIILNFILIPQYLYYGTAVSIILTEVLIVVLQYSYIKLKVFPHLDTIKVNMMNAQVLNEV